MTTQALNRPVGQTVRAKRAIHAYIKHGTDPEAMRRATRYLASVPAQPDPCQFCYAPDDREIGLPLILGWCAMGLGVMGVFAAVFYAALWVAGLFFGANV